MREEFLITRQGKQFVLFAGLLDQAHSQGLRSIETELIEYKIPLNKNDDDAFAVVKATVEMEDGKTFQGIGDATKVSVGPMIFVHILRMAETRAKARALRDAINVGMTALEELMDEGDGSQNSPQRGATGSRSSSGGSSRGAGGLKRQNQSSRPSPSSRNQTSDQTGDQPELDEAAAVPLASEQQVKAIEKLAEEAHPDGDKDAAITAIEEKAGYPIGMMSEREAGEWIEKLNKRKAELARGAQRSA